MLVHKFIDTIKYYQQSLASLEKSVDQTKKLCIRSSCLKLIQQIFQTCLMKTKMGYCSIYLAAKESYHTKRLSHTKISIVCPKVKLFKNLNFTAPSKTK